VNSVTAVMITGHIAKRRPLAMEAIRCFANQSWSNRELLIINSGVPLDVADGAERQVVRQIMVQQESMTLGELRNMAFDRADGEWLIQWDDDDWHHPCRIAEQMKVAQSGGASLLGSQVRHVLGTPRTMVRRIANGIDGTILHERRVTYRYPAKKKGEDSDFVRQFPARFIVEDRPELYVRFFHGANTWHERHIMGKGEYLDHETYEFIYNTVLPLYQNSGIAS
jgi:glycosyltransferase involved in cell wall biosynthesis